MKRLFSCLVTIALWIAGTISGVASPPPYPVTFPAGFSTFVNHLSPGSLQNLLGPGVPDMQVIFTDNFYNAPPGTSEVHVSDGSGWFEMITGNPSTRIMATGEGAFIFNPGVTPISLSIPVISGVASPGIVQISPSSPTGFHVRGRQDIWDGTFESTFGRSPEDYSSVHLYRFANNNYTGFFQYGNGKWSPSAPILNVGEAAVFKLGTLGATTPIFPATPFTVSGLTPATGVDGSTVTLRVVGTGLAVTDNVQLIPMVGPNIPIQGTVMFVEPERYISTVQFPFSGGNNYHGYYKLRVQQITGPPTIIDNIFHLASATSPLSLTLTGPTLTKVSPWLSTYTFCVSGSGLASIRFELPNGMSFSPAVVPVGTTALPPLNNPPGFTANVNLGGGGSQCYTFNLSAANPLLGSTVDLVGKITAPLASIDQIRLPVEVVASLDPNEKLGPLGVGAGRYITGLAPSDYVVTFENKPTASAPAQEVFITDQLDVTKFDLTTFELGPITFGPKVVYPPAGAQTYTTDVPYDVDGNPLTLNDNILVRINAALDNVFVSPTFGEVKWTFLSLQSTPPHLPVNLANVGFLPANTAPPQGQGSVSFKVTPFPNLASGDTIENDASIVFDSNAAIVTGTWLNTIDVSAPNSSVSVLPATQSTTSFTVNWSGNDPHSGVATYDVYVSDNNAPYTKWQNATTATSDTFAGQPNHSYRFYSVAVDKLGNTEDAPATPDAETTVTLPVLSYPVNLPPGFSMIANHLDQGGNTLDEVLPSVPEETMLLKWNCATKSYSTYTFFTDLGGWIDEGGAPAGSQTLQPGEGAFVLNPSSTTSVVLFTGTPRTPVLPPPLACGCGETNLLSRQTMDLGTYDSIVGEPPLEGSQVLRFAGGSFNAHTFAGGSWSPTEPVLNIGEAAFFYTPCITNCITLQCASNLVVECGTQWSFTEPSAVGACCGSNVTITVSSTVTNGLCPQVITRTWLAADGCSNTASCSQTVTIVDTTPPVMNCSSNKTVECGSNWSFNMPTVSDACCGTNVTVSVLNTVTNGSCPTAITRTWMAVDCCGNTNTCSQTVTIIDNTPPVIICPTNIVVLSATNTPVCYSATATDNCSSNVTIVCTPPSCTTFAVGTTNTVICVATDVCGNTNTCSFTVTVPRARGDLYAEDTPLPYPGTPDQGGEPDVNMIGQPMWLSRSIWAHEDCTAPAGDYFTHQNPRYGQQNCVFTLIKNRGSLPVAGAHLEIYYVNASLGLSWPGQWTLIGTDSLPVIPPGGSHIARLSWVPPGTGHYCLLARIVSVDDPMTTPEGPDIDANVRANNNLAWRNMNVTDCVLQPADKVEVRVRNPWPTPRKITIACKTGEDFLGTGGEALLDLGPVFERWQAAGGRGTNVVVAGENQVRLTGHPARLEDIPFERDEEHIINLTMRAREPMPGAGTNRVYYVELEQEEDGKRMGGVGYAVNCRAQDTDTDRDGIPDVTDPDDDNDGIPDAQDPNPLGDPSCEPAGLTIRKVGRAVVVTWSGLNYRLQSRRSFDEPWVNRPGRVSPAVFPANDAHEFYRLICP